MFKSSTIYQLTQATAAVLERLTKEIGDYQFRHCLPTQARSAGFVPPVGETELLYETNGGVLMCLRIDMKEIPSSAIQHAIDAIVAQRTGAGEDTSIVDIRLIKERLIEDALPNTLAKITERFAYIDKQSHMLIIEGNDLDADEFMMTLKKVLGGTPFKLLGILDDPCVIFTAWIREPESLFDMSLGDSCSLKHPQEGGTSVINIKSDDLESRYIKDMIEDGKSCCRIALKHPDADFAITAKLGIRRMTLSPERQIEAFGSGEDAGAVPTHFATVVTVYRNILTSLEPLLGGWPQQELLDLNNTQGQAS